MSINLPALLALFPAPQIPHPFLEDDETGDTIRGPCPYGPEWRDTCTPEFNAAMDAILSNDRYRRLFEGDLSDYDGDQSRADLAFCCELARQGLGAQSIDTALRSSKLFRDKWERDDYRRATIRKALESTKRPTNHTGLLDLRNGQIAISTAEPPARVWTVYDLLLAGKSAVIGGFGGASKTMFAIQLAVAIVLGRSFIGKAVKQGGVLLLLGEEDRSEIERRVNAIARCQNLDPQEIQLIKSNLLAFPLVGKDVRLTAKEKSALNETQFQNELIDAAKGIEELQLIVLDHLGLFHGGDFNAREDAALTMRVVNHIAQQTGAAMLVIAHTPKSANLSEQSDASMVAGSTAFVDQARGAWILATMRQAEATKFKMSEEERLQHVSLSVVKNNYGPTGAIYWFKRVPFDGVAILEDVKLSVHAANARGAATLGTKIVDFVRNNPGQYAKTKLRDSQSGKQRAPFYASKGDVEKMIEMLLADGRLVNRPPTDPERQKFGLPARVKHVLDIGP